MFINKYNIVYHQHLYDCISMVTWTFMLEGYNGLASSSSMDPKENFLSFGYIDVSHSSGLYNVCSMYRSVSQGDKTTNHTRFA